MQLRLLMEGKITWLLSLSIRLRFCFSLCTYKKPRLEKAAKTIVQRFKNSPLAASRSRVLNQAGRRRLPADCGLRRDLCLSLRAGRTPILPRFLWRFAPRRCIGEGGGGCLVLGPGSVFQTNRPPASDPVKMKYRNKNVSQPSGCLRKAPLRHC